jgi:hypothetical protein
MAVEQLAEDSRADDRHVRPAVRRPNFFLVGAMKAGTTAMHQYLAQHPDIFMSPRKEPRFFAPDLDSGSAADGLWFTRSLDDYLANFEGAKDERVVGESSHVYLHSEVAARLIRDFAPDARILIMLRDPVAMIHSRHQQSVWMAREDIRDFAQALAAEADRREGRRLPPNAPYTKGLQYREACVLTPQVRRYLDTFGRDRVHVVVLEEVAARPLEVYRGVLEFLGVDPDFKPSRLGVVNPSSEYRNLLARRVGLFLSDHGRGLKRRLPSPLRSLLGAPNRLLRKLNRRVVPRRMMSPELEAELTRYFATDVKELSDLLNVDLHNWWPRFSNAPE